MSAAFSAAERLALQAMLRAGQPLLCPACGGDVTQQPVERPPGVSYVRHRVMLICSQCRRSAAVDK